MCITVCLFSLVVLLYTVCACVPGGSREEGVHESCVGRAAQTRSQLASAPHTRPITSSRDVLYTFKRINMEKRKVQGGNSIPRSEYLRSR